MKIFLSSLSIPVIKKLHGINPVLKPNVLITFYGLKKPADYITAHGKDQWTSGCGRSVITANKKHVSKYKIECEKSVPAILGYTKLTQSDYDYLFSFDDDFTSEGFEHNIQRLMDLEAAGVKAMPVIHNLHNHEIDYFIDAKPKYPLVAIGQCKEDNRNDLAVLFEAVDSLYPKGIKVHSSASQLRTSSATSLRTRVIQKPGLITQVVDVFCTTTARVEC
jgi:hypothetical protein